MAELTFIGFDEVQQLNKDSVLYLFSRLRSTTVDYKKQILATGNPDYDSFIREWVEHGLDQRGIPIRKEIYPNRYFITQGDSVIWNDSLEELENLYGKANVSGIMSFKFVPGTIEDNPPLMKADPSYLSKLKSLPRVEMERLLLGSWYARATAAGLYKREWSEEVDAPNPLSFKRVRAWDCAGTLPNPGVNADPDYTIGLLMSKDKNSIYTVEDMQQMRDRFYKVEELIMNTARNDGVDTIIAIPCDPGASAGAWAKNLQRKLGEAGYYCRLVRPQTSKVSRFAPFSTVAQAGFVKVVKADWNKRFYDELESFDPVLKSQHDDIVDTCSDCMLVLNQGNVLPDLSPASFVPNFSSNTSGHSEMFSQLNPNSPVHQSVLPSYSFPSFLK
jgi:predicted phage terminase large subunit-like protein